MAEGGECRDERRRSSASEVGTDDGTAKKKEKKKRLLLPMLEMYKLTCRPTKCPLDPSP